MSQEEKKEEKKYTDREKLDMELAAINILQQVGVSVKIPLRRRDFVRRGWYTLFREKVSQEPNIKALPGDVEVVKTQLPDPKDPTVTVDAHVADVRIRPLFVDTIDSIRAKFIAMSLKEENMARLIDKNDESLLKYEDDMCEILAMATINEGANAKKGDIRKWAAFYRTHLTNSRLFHVVRIVIAMYDTASFLASIRLVAEVGTTAPRSTKRIESETSKD